MAKFAIPVATLRDNELVQFAAGQDVPQWVLDEDIVGDHCLVPEDLDDGEETDGGGEKPADPEDEKQDDTPADDAEKQDETPADGDDDETPAVPDFTKPRARAARTSTPRK